MDDLNILEFDLVLKAIEQYSVTVKGRELVLNLKPFDNEEEATIELKMVNEAFDFYTRFGSFPFNQSHNLSLILESARQGNILSPHDLYLISSDILTLVKINEFVSDKIKDFPLLGKELSKQSDLILLRHKIEKTISPNLLVKDDASNELKRIRKHILMTEEKISRTANSLLAKYNSVLAEKIVTMREGRYVIPVKSSDKNKISGVIYDISNSGQTIFVEPEEMGELNKLLISYQNDEIIEVNAILRALTSEVLLSFSQIILNNDLIAYLDFVFAKAKYGSKYNALTPNFTKEKGLKFINARHPLIAQDKVVANTFTLENEHFVIIISGPNAGGKTVALKTIGLLIVMAKAGLMLPVSVPATLYFYQNVYATIGDLQTLTGNLSTFSGHVSQISHILKIATANDLVLLDELGTGTSPEEGEALAIGVTAYLHKHNISAIISSHYSKLKEYAYSAPGIANASMAFSEEKLEPLYKYHENVPGRSYGLVVAKRFGIDQSIIQEAEAFLSDKNSTFEKTIGKLRSEVQETIELKAKLSASQKELEAKIANLDNEVNKYKKLQTEFIASRQEMLEEQVKETQEQLNVLLKKALQGGEKAHEIIALRKEVDDLVSEEDEQEEMPKNKVAVSLGHFVIINPLNVIGEVVFIKGDNASVRLADGKVMKVSLTSLQITKAPVSVKTKPVVTTEYKETLTSIKPEINLIGLTVSEALSVLDQYLDQCRSKNYTSVRLIHGFGSGALRRGIHVYLKKQSFVKGFTLAGQYDGAGGATIVTFI